MTTIPNFPCLLKSGLVLIAPASAALQRADALQYNLDTLSLTLQVKTGDGELSR
jgi:hypothetical protein